MRREAYVLERNKVEQQLAQHYLERDMAEDYEASTRVSPKEHARNLKVQNLVLLAFLVFALGSFGLAVWLY
jgi:hypothetical protein